MIKLADKKDCSGCMNCIISCPRKAIKFDKDKLDNIYPSIDISNCVECRKCVSVCPQMNGVTVRLPYKCYAAHSTKDDIRKNSASGGVATSIYEMCIAKDWGFAGVYFDYTKMMAKFKLGHNKEDINLFKNSKYTFSFMNTICKDILIELESRKVCFIGLPCQVAAVKKYISVNNGFLERLFTVDLVCHGVPSHLYLADHINKTLHTKDIEEIKFRDEEYQTSKFVFSVSYNGKKYIKYVDSNDNYQIGYHNATIYRPNCYNCHWARPERTGDITISDFSGFGNIAPFGGDIKHEKYLGMSCVLINSDNGNKLIKELMDDCRLKCYERPLEEALNYEKQLKNPSKPSAYRVKFEKDYPEKGFTKTCNRIFKSEKIKRPIIKKGKDCIKFFLRRK